MGKKLRWTLTIKTQYSDGLHVHKYTSSLEATTSYLKPVVTGATSSDTMATTGGSLITITGQNFGPTLGPDQQATKVIVNYGPKDRKKAYFGSECKVIAHTKIECKTAPGVGTNLFFQVEIGTGNRQASNVYESTLDYGAPTLTTMPCFLPA